MLWVTLAYGVVGAVSLVLAAPGALATPLSPAAGVGLAAALRFGVLGSLGVAAASFTVNVLWTRYLGHGGLQAWLLPAAFAGGAALQSWVSAWLVERLVGHSPRLDTPSAVLRFMLGGALLGCLVGASVAVGAARLLGAAPDPMAMWWTWWSGDALGTLVATPVALAFIGRPAGVWRPRRWTVAVPLALGATLFGWASHELDRWTAQRAQLAFERDARSAVGTVALTLERQLDALQAMHALFDGGEAVSRARFRTAALTWLQRLPSLYAMGYSERIARGDAARVEAIRRQDERPDYRVFEREAAIAAHDADWVAIRFIEPEDRNAAAVGVNALSVSAARRAITDAFRQRAVVGTAGFVLTQVGQTGVVVYQPVALPNNGGWRGVVFATLRMDEALRGLGGQLPAGMMLCIVDRSAGARVRLAGPEGCEADNSGHWTHALGTRFATRDWEVRASAPRAVYAAGAQYAGEAGIFALSGMAATALLGLFLLTLSGRAQRSEDAARRRAAELGRERVSRDHEHHARLQSERRFEALFNDVPVGVAFTEPAGTVVEANAAMAALLGVDQGSLRGLSVREFIAADDWPEHMKHRRDLAEGHITVMRRRVRMLRRGDDEPFPAMVTARRVLGDDAAAVRIVSLVEDWSERDQLETARRARMQAEAANVAKSGFLSRMSHELRTPLNAILGFTQLLAMNKSDALPPQHQQWLTQIQGAGWHLLQMIEEVLDLSKIEAGELKLELRPVPLLPLIEECMSMVATDAKAKQVTLSSAQHLCDPALVVQADATRLRQVMLNLLSNAVKYNRPGGEVTLACTLLPDGQVRVDVRDTGLGMGQEQLQRLFRPFDRLGRESTGVQGAGIGLVIARHLAELMNGRLDVASRQGEGSTFSVTLARHGEGQGPQRAPDSEGVPDAAYRRRRVLLVEDNELNIELMRGLLAQRPQVHLQVFQTGLPAAAAARVHPPDALILDVNLPDINGIELLKQLKADPLTAEVPVMVISASVLAEDIQRASDAGAAAFLGKPVVASRFLSMLDEFLGQATTDFGGLDSGG